MCKMKIGLCEIHLTFSQRGEASAQTGKYNSERLTVVAFRLRGLWREGLRR